MSKEEIGDYEAQRIERWQQAMVEWLGDDVRRLLCHFFMSHQPGLEIVRHLIERSKQPSLFYAACEIYWVQILKQQVEFITEEDRRGPCV